MRFPKRKFSVISVLSLILIFALSETLLAQANKGKILRRNIKLKEVSGEVMFARADSIAILYNRDEGKGIEEDILFTFDPKQIKLEHMRSLADITKGDIVRVQYDEVDEQYENAGEEKSLRAKVIAFVKKGVPLPPAAQDEEDEESSVLISGE